MEEGTRGRVGAARRIALGTLVGIALLAADAGEAAAQTRPRGPLGDSVVPAGILAADARREAAEAARDTAALGRHLAPEFYWVAPDGEVLSRASRMWRVARSQRATDSLIDLGQPIVRSLSDTLVLVTRATTIWGVRGGGAAAGVPLRVTKLYVRRDGEWLLLFQQGSPLAPAHAPAPSRP